ncbi:hypothetical protein DUI87_11372 [Hirundo rustica rustica]|uniref:DOCKER domain-containing protein n=1 Tax=Hirundo rustica rustica TaxID=333673 RepID=A0A3M0KIZ5_HIRRU|nr:hypothetical protein DUI87_11372 [Hirundo rustica rustica]
MLLSLHELFPCCGSVTPRLRREGLEQPNSALQIPFLAEGIRIHGEKVTEALRPFHERMEACFRQLKDKVEKQYGARAILSSLDDRRGSRPRSMVRSFTMPSSSRPLSVASVSSLSSDSTPSRPGSDGFVLEPLLPKKMHSRSQDKLDKDDLDKDKKEKKKEKRNSKHQEIFDKEFKPTDISLQQAEAVILSETISPLRPQRPKSQVLNVMSSERRFSVSPAPPSSQLTPPPITPRTKLAFSIQPNLELNGMSSSDSPDIPPPLPLKGSTADYGNLLESQDLISPTTSPPAHQRHLYFYKLSKTLECGFKAWQEDLKQICPRATCPVQSQEWHSLILAAPLHLSRFWIRFRIDFGEGF